MGRTGIGISKGQEGGMLEGRHAGAQPQSIRETCMGYGPSSKP